MQLPVILPKDSSGVPPGLALLPQHLYQTNTVTQHNTTPQNTTRISAQPQTFRIQLSQTHRASSLGEKSQSKEHTDIRTRSIPVFNNTSCSFQTLNLTGQPVSKNHTSSMNIVKYTETRFETKDALSTYHRNDEAEKTKAAFTLPYKVTDTTSKAKKINVESNSESRNSFSSEVMVAKSTAEPNTACVSMSVRHEQGKSSKPKRKVSGKITQTGQNQNKRKSIEVDQKDTTRRKRQKIQRPANHEHIVTTKVQKYILPKKNTKIPEVETVEKSTTTNKPFNDKKTHFEIDNADKRSSDKTNTQLVSNSIVQLRSTNSINSNNVQYSKTLKGIQDHYLLSKPLSFEESNSLVSRNRLDLRLKYAQNVVATTSLNVVQEPFRNTGLFKNHSTFSKEDKVLPNSIKFGIVSLDKLFISNKPKEQPELIYKSSDINEFGKCGNKRGHTYYIISNENMKTQNVAPNEQRSHSMECISNRIVQTADKVTNKKGDVKSYNVNGLVIASRKSTSHHTNGSQTQRKEETKGTDLHRKHNLVFKGYSIKKNNDLHNKHCYNSKLTVKQLLKNKRDEERLDTMLKSDLNKTCNTKIIDEKTTEVTTEYCDAVYKEHTTENTGNILPRSDGSGKSEIGLAPIEKHSNDARMKNKTINTTPCDIKECNKGTEMVNPNTTGKLKESQTHSDLKCESPRSFSVKLGAKMVMMKRNLADQSPSQKARKKLPPPKPTNQDDKQKRLTDEPREKSNVRSQKEILVENLFLMPKSKLIENSNEDTSVFRETDSIETLPIVATPNCVPKTLSASILQIWKTSYKTFKHTTQSVEIELLSKNDGKFRRWHQYSDYPCVIQFTSEEKITKIVTGSIKPGFFLVTKTTARPAPGLVHVTYDMFCMLSMYPANLNDLPENSMAIYICNLSGNHSTDTIGTKDMLNSLLQTLERSVHYIRGKDGRYSSIIEADMSPRTSSPAFYTEKLHEYFSNLHTLDNFTKETKGSDSIDKNLVRSLGKPKGFNSKVEALKKKQKDLLKTCRNFTCSRNIKATENISFNLSTQVEHYEDDDQSICVVDTSSTS